MPGWRPFGQGEIAQLSATVSPASGKQYGVERVCAIFEHPRSTFYARQRSVEQIGNEAAPASRKRGPKTNAARIWLGEVGVWSALLGRSAELVDAGFVFSCLISGVGGDARDHLGDHH
jgi:hypothetical protein